MPEKSINTRVKNARAVMAAIESHGETLLEHLTAALSEELESGEELPDLELFFELLGRRLKRRQEEIADAENARLDERAAAREPKRRRDEAAARLTGYLVDLGQAVDAAYGRGLRPDAVGLDGRVPRRHLELVRQGRITVGRLADLNERMPPERGFTIEPSYWVGRIEKAAADLEDALEMVQTQLKESQRTAGLRVRVRRAFDADYFAIGRILDGCFRFAGLAKLADRLLPRSHRPPRRRKAAKPAPSGAAGKKAPSAPGPAGKEAASPAAARPAARKNAPDAAARPAADRGASTGAAQPASKKT